MELRSLVLVLEAREPLSYGEESVGIKMLIKRISLYLPEEGRVISVPVVLGNALRGVLRDTMAEVFIEELLKHIRRPRWHAGSLVVLFSGGLLKAVERGERAMSGQIAARIAELLKYLLPLSIMGCALPGRMVPSKIKVSTFYPVCSETRPLVQDLVAQVGSSPLRGRLDKALGCPIDDLILDVQLMRKDDILKILQMARARGLELTHVEEVGAEEGPRARGKAVQMLFYRQALAPGTLLIGKISELMPLRDEELGLLFLALRRLSAVGGAIARGFGEVMLHPAYDVPEADEAEAAFRSFIEESAATISEFLSRSPEEWIAVGGS